MIRTRLVWPAALGALLACGEDVRMRVDAPLSGAAEVPPVATSATGNLRATLEGDRLELSGTFEGLSSELLDVGGSPAHIHQAPPGENGPVIFNVQVTSTEPGRGTFGLSQRLTTEQQQVLLAGQFYFNIHTVNFPGGELRAQLLEAPPETQTFDVTLSGGQEVPPVTTNATGTVRVVNQADALVLTGDFRDLSSPLFDVSGSPAHIHRGLPGQAGPIVLNVVVTPGPDQRSGTFQFADRLSQDLLAAYENGELYLNVHTTNNPGGEIRAQLREGGVPGL